MNSPGRFALAIAFSWILVIAFIGPFGEFPLNDDWAYSIPVKNLVENGELEYSKWTSVSLLAQIFWGYAFCGPAGFSFSLLRISTLVAAGVAFMTLYRLLSIYGMNPSRAFLATACFAFQPLVLNLSFTFMTDIPFLTCFLLAVLFFVQYFRNPGWANLIFALVFSLLAMMIRQSGIFIPAGACMALILKKVEFNKALPVFGACIFLVVLLLLWERNLKFCFGYAVDGVSLFGNYFTQERFQHAGLNFAKLFVKLFWFSGLAFLPLLLSKSAFGFSGRQVFPVVLASVFTLAMFLIGELFPFSFNIWNEAGVGMVGLKEIYLGFPVSFPMPLVVKIVLTFLGAWGGILLAAGMLSRKQEATDLKRPEFYFLLSLGFIMIVGLSVWGPFDRYIIPVMAMVPLVFYSSIAKGTVHFTGIVLLGLTGLFSSAATRQHLSWNEARWQLLNDQISNGVSPSKIDGGFEFNGLYGYDSEYVPPVDRSWWWVRDDSLVIGFHPLPGYVKTDSAAFQTLLPWKEAQVYLLRRN